MKSVVFSLIALVLACLPGLADAKERGCNARLNALADAQLALDIALQRGQPTEEASVAVSRARQKALEEGCLQTRVERGSRLERSQRYEDRSYLGERDAVEQRFDQLVELGYRRGLTREEFRELESLRRRLRR